ncbi:OmpA family protein [Roseinatronobacter monicus]|uniref:Outer membrane protein OmpA-like peptidoglycan-associated protein n=1 Tax=Roseinatronobacter monicus TaxID=393481 RepID=A0A543KG58_9RHOB|nr:OmpA family protein [Roseinatronobacter monicus]TQM94071.1 outer membrane protein OmpA-like peptidoglycan-associated protein [Roseinatronobacter monicus]
MKKHRILSQIIGIFIIALPVYADEPGTDNPLVSRYSGAVMHGYLEREYDAVSLPSGPLHIEAYHNRRGWDAEILQAVEIPLEGRVTWITYQAPENRSVLEILRNYQQALVADGFDLQFECVDRTGCGSWMSKYVRDMVMPRSYQRQLRRSMVPPTSFHGRASLAGRENQAGSAHVFLFIMDMDQPVIHKVVVEGVAMQAGLVETGVRSADELQASLTTVGKAIIDGIFFEHDSADIRPESIDALAQMAQLLENNPDINVLVVGHTDNQGSFDYNADLSLRRAEAVRRALASDYGITTNRMVAKGASFMAPVASNTSEEGRELNRRVELVLK